MRSDVVFKAIEAMTLGISPEHVKEIASSHGDGSKLEERLDAQIYLVQRSVRSSVPIWDIRTHLGDYTATLIEPDEKMGPMILQEFYKRDLKYEEAELAIKYLGNEFRSAIHFAEGFIEEAEMYVFNPDKSSSYLCAAARLISFANRNLKIMNTIVPEDHVYAIPMREHEACEDVPMRLNYGFMVERLHICFDKYHNLAEFPDFVRRQMFDKIDNRVRQLKLNREKAIEQGNPVLVGMIDGTIREYFPSNS